MYIGTLYSCSVLMTLEFSRQIFFKNPQISNFMKIRPVEARLFHADRRTAGRTDGRTDRRTDMMKLTVAFCNFVKAPHKKYPNLLAISFRQELPYNSTAWNFYICITGVRHFITENRN